MLAIVIVACLVAGSLGFYWYIHKDDYRDNGMFAFVLIDVSVTGNGSYELWIPVWTLDGEPLTDLMNQTVASNISGTQRTIDTEYGPCLAFSGNNSGFLRIGGLFDFEKDMGVKGIDHTLSLSTFRSHIESIRVFFSVLSGQVNITMETLDYTFHFYDNIRDGLGESRGDGALSTFYLKNHVTLENGWNTLELAGFWDETA